MEERGAGRAAGTGRAHAPGFAGRGQVAELRRRQGQVRAVAAPAAGPVEAPARRRHGRLPAAAAFPHGLADLQRARHRPRHARGHALLRRAVQAGLRRSATWTSAAASAIDYEGTRSRSFNARSTTACSSTRTTSCSRWPRPARRARPAAAADRDRVRPRDDRAPCGAGGQRVRGRARAGRRGAGRARRRTGRDPPPARDPRALDARPAVELFHEAQHYQAEGQALYAQRPARPGAARAPRRPVLRHRHGCARAWTGTRSATARCSTSSTTSAWSTSTSSTSRVFESMPDVWAIDQVFPIVPIERLDEAPAARRDRRPDLRFRRPDRGLRRRATSTPRCRCTRCARRSYRSASSWSAPTRRSWATSTTCSATPTRSR
jgi:hypothetical protein